MSYLDFVCFYEIVYERFVLVVPSPTAKKVRAVTPLPYTNAYSCYLAICYMVRGYCVPRLLCNHMVKLLFYAVYFAHVDNCKAIRGLLSMLLTTLPQSQR